MKLNLGCGRRPLQEYLNVDIDADLPGAQLRATATALPFRDASFVQVNASQVLEHIPDLTQAMKEIKRVLVVGGELHADVPYGLQGLLNPFHVHAFEKRTLLYFCDPAGPQQPPRGLRMISQRTFVAACPFGWHLWQHTPWLAHRLQPLWNKLNFSLELPLLRRALLAVIRKVD